MGGVWHWIFFSRGFQHIVFFKLVAKSIDRDFQFCIVYYMGQHAHFLCACDRVQPPLDMDYLIASLKFHELCHVPSFLPREYLISRRTFTALASTELAEFLSSKN